VPFMPLTSDALDALKTHLHNRRSAVVLGLFGLAGVHVMDLSAKWEETFYLAIGYIAIIAVAAVLIERLTVRGSQLDYLASAGLSSAVLLAFVVNRTVGMPGAMDDIGNWFEPLGMLSLAIELFAVWHSIAGFLAIRKIQRLTTERFVGNVTAFSSDPATTAPASS
jgi:hypothetical protein